MADHKAGAAGGSDYEEENDQRKLDEMKKHIEQRTKQMLELEQQLGRLVWQQMTVQHTVTAAEAEIMRLQGLCNRVAELEVAAQLAAAQREIYQQQLDDANQRCLALQREIKDAYAREAKLKEKLLDRYRRQTRSDEPPATPADPARYDDPPKDPEPAYSPRVEPKADSYRLAVDLNELRKEPSAGAEVLILNKANNAVVGSTRANDKGLIDTSVKVREVLLVLREPSSAERAPGKNSYDVKVEPAR